MPGFIDLVGFAYGSRITPSLMLPSAYLNGVGSPDYAISRLNSPACTYPCQRFACSLTGTDA